MSMPKDESSSGCPGVFDLYCRNFFKSSADILNPFRWSKEYKSIEPCPGLRINLSLFIQEGFSLETFKNFL